MELKRRGTSIEIRSLVRMLHELRESGLVRFSEQAYQRLVPRKSAHTPQEVVAQTPVTKKEPEMVAPAAPKAAFPSTLTLAGSEPVARQQDKPALDPLSPLSDLADKLRSAGNLFLDVANEMDAVAVDLAANAQEHDKQIQAYEKQLHMLKVLRELMAGQVQGA